MAMIDYGAIAFKNGKMISTDMFTPMIDMVGWEDTEADTYHDYRANTDKPLNLCGNYFAYVGDKDVTVGFYKCGLCIVEWLKDGFYLDEEWFSNYPYTWTKWRKYAAGEDMVVTKRNGYYVFKWKYKDDKYKVYFGYGVDYDCYKKYRIVNYYRSPMYIIRHKIPREIKNKIWDWKYGR